MAIAQTVLAAKPYLYPASLQLSLALSARDNLESFFSYVEEVERNHSWRLQICELGLYSPLSPPSPHVRLSLPLCPAVTRRRGSVRKSQASTWTEEEWSEEGRLQLGPSCGFWSDHCAAAQPSTSEVPAEGFSNAARWAQPFVCYLNPGFGEIQSWLSNKSIWEDKEHLGNGFSLPV